MLALRQNALKSVRRVAVTQNVAKLSSTSKVAAGHSESSHHDDGHSAPKDEPLGGQLYIPVAVLAACYATYLVSRPKADGSHPAITQSIIDWYSGYEKTWKDRNAVHAQSLEQAATDKTLFYHSKPDTMINLRFPEIFNSGSPYNVSAGQQTNLDHLVEHYHKLSAAAEAKKIEELEARAAAAKESAKG